MVSCISGRYTSKVDRILGLTVAPRAAAMLLGFER